MNIKATGIGAIADSTENADATPDSLNVKSPGWKTWIRTFLFYDSLTRWVKWLVKSSRQKWRNRHKNISIGYMADITHTVFGKYNKIAPNAYLLEVKLGDFTYISDNSRIVNTRIGNYCSIAPNVQCGGFGRHPSRTFVSTHPAFYSTLKQANMTYADKTYFNEFDDPVEIGNDVWVGLNAIIMGGIKIGHGAIIAGGAIVTKDVPPYAIVGGNPAKIIRYRFSEEEIENLLYLRWWDKDPEWIRKNFRFFHNIEDYMELEADNLE